MKQTFGALRCSSHPPTRLRLVLPVADGALRGPGLARHGHTRAADAGGRERRSAARIGCVRGSLTAEISDNCLIFRARAKEKGATLARNPLIFMAPRPGLEPGTYGLTVPGDGIFWDLLIQLAFGILFTYQQLTSTVVSGRLGPFPRKLAPDWHQISYGLWQEIKYQQLPPPSKHWTAVPS